MKIAIAATGSDLKAATDPRFGRCRTFVIVDSESLAYVAVDNLAAAQGSGAGIAATQLVADQGAEVVIASSIGPNAHQALVAGGLQVYGFAGGTVREAVAAWQAGQLEALAAPNVASHHGLAGAAVPPPTNAAAETQLQDLRRQLNTLAEPERP